MDANSNPKLPGLPALPKSLSGLLNANSGIWRETSRILAHQTDIQDHLAAGFSPSHVKKSGGRKKRKRIEIPRGNLDAALALLRKEMVGLRQLDMSLLSELWSLHESIQEYKSDMEKVVDSSLDLDPDDSQISQLSTLDEDAEEEEEEE
ncbi:leucine repeat adapter protein 25-like [Diadema antillarum]